MIKVNKKAYFVTEILCLQYVKLLDASLINLLFMNSNLDANIEYILFITIP